MDKPTVAAIVDDMFFAAKINSAAQSSGREVARIRSREQLDALKEADPPALLIVDLNSDRLDPVEAIEHFKSQDELREIPVVAFVSHVQTDLIRRAQDAGCDYVMPRSAFNQMLQQIVSGDFSSLRPSRSGK